MESNVKTCPKCGRELDEKGILYKGYYVCSSCAYTVNESQNADLIRKYSNLIRNLEFKRADALRNELLDEANLDVNELQLFTFYSAILNLFLTKDPSKIIKFLDDSTSTDVGVVIEVANFLTSLAKYIEKLGPYILKYIHMQEKYLSNLSNQDLENAIIELKKRYYKSIQNKSAFIQESFKSKRMNLNEIIDLVHEMDPTNIASLYSIFDYISIDEYSADEINHYLLTCDYSLELYFEKNKRKISTNFKEYYKKSNALRKKLNLKVQERYKWQKKVSKRKKGFLRIFYLVVILLSIVIYANT